MIEDDDPYADLKRHRMTPELQQIVDRARAEKKQRKTKTVKPAVFIKVPWSWFERLTRARHASTYHMALLILHMHWRKKVRTFPLPNGQLDGRTGRWGKYTGLAEMEQLGLIQQERRRKKSPLVTVILDVEP